MGWSDLIASSAGGWSAFGLLALTSVISFFRGWIVPRSIHRERLADKEEKAELYRRASEIAQDGTDRAISQLSATVTQMSVILADVSSTIKTWPRG